MAETPPSPVEINNEVETVEQHKMSVIGALAKRLIEQLYFRNVLAIAMVGTLCVKEIQGIPLSEHFYMLAALVVGMYFPSGDKAAR